MNLRERYRFVLKQNNVSVSDLAGGNGTALQAKVNRQINGDTAITSDVIELLLGRFNTISADWLMRGEGAMERTDASSSPTHHQDIHVEQGATAAISQSGNAHVEEPASSEFTSTDIARMIKESDIAGMIAIIMAQKDEIIRLKEQRITDLEREMHK